MTNSKLIKLNSKLDQELQFQYPYEDEEPSHLGRNIAIGAGGAGALGAGYGGYRLYKGAMGRLDDRVGGMNARRGAGEAMATRADAARSIADDAVLGVRERVRGTLGRGRETMDDAYQGARQRVGDTVEGTRDSARRGGRRMRRRAQVALERTGRRVSRFGRQARTGAGAGLDAAKVVMNPAGGVKGGLGNFLKLRNLRSIGSYALTRGRLQMSARHNNLIELNERLDDVLEFKIRPMMDDLYRDDEGSLYTPTDRIKAGSGILEYPHLQSGKYTRVVDNKGRPTYLTRGQSSIQGVMGGVGLGSVTGAALGHGSRRLGIASGAIAGALGGGIIGGVYGKYRKLPQDRYQEE